MPAQSAGDGDDGAPRDERSAERVVVDLTLDAAVRDRICRVSIFDLSKDGCKIETADGPLAEGDEVAFTLPGEHQIAGHIVWTHGNHAGVAFGQPLHPALVAHLGFRPSAPFLELRDRFGRPLPTNGRKPS